MKTNSMIAYELECAGMKIDTVKFPYTYHHDYVLHQGMSRPDAAHKLMVACGYDMNMYDYSACYGAIQALISEQPETITKEVCDVMKYTRSRSIYDIGTCGRHQMRVILGISF